MEVGFIKKSEFYTLTGYKIKDNLVITPAMEDYIEMIFRYTKNNGSITVKELAQLLNVRCSSVSKMLVRLNSCNLVNYTRYGIIALTNKGKKAGRFYLHRHELLSHFFRLINHNDFKLEQVEKVEHYIDSITVRNINKFIKKNKG